MCRHPIKRAMNRHIPTSNELYFCHQIHHDQCRTSQDHIHQTGEIVNYNVTIRSYFASRLRPITTPLPFFVDVFLIDSRRKLQSSSLHTRSGTLPISLKGHIKKIITNVQPRLLLTTSEIEADALLIESRAAAEKRVMIIHVYNSATCSS